MTDLADAYHQIVDKIPNQAGRFATEADFNAAEAKVEEIYAHLMTLDGEEHKAAGKKDYKPGEVVTVLFLDEWFNSTSEEGAGRRSRVTANSQTQLLIGMTRWDRDSQNMLTHELTHALRRHGHHNNQKCFNQFKKANNVANSEERGWEEHYSGKPAANAMAMTRVSRKNPTEAENDLTSKRLLSVREYLTVVIEGYADCQSPCDVKPDEPDAGAGR
jgi:hypothetical protein